MQNDVRGPNLLHGVRDVVPGREALRDELPQGHPDQQIKVDTENKRSRKLLNTLPLTLQYMDAAAAENDYLTGALDSSPADQTRGAMAGRAGRQRAPAQEQDAF